MKRIYAPVISLLGLSAFLVCPLLRAASVVEMVYVSKAIDYVQTGADSSTIIVDPAPLSPTNGGPYGFAVNVVGVDLAGITPPTVTGPFNLNQSNGPSTFSHNGGILGYDADDQSWRYGASNFNDWGTTSQAANDTFFPNGTYTVTVNNTSVSLHLSGDAYPNTPALTLTGGQWVDGAYEIVVGQQLGITSNTFSGYGTHVNDAITLWLGDNRVMQSFAATAPNANSVSQVVDTSSLISGSSYDLDLDFTAIVAQSSALPGTLAVAAYNKSVGVIIRAVTVATPAPSAFTNSTSIAIPDNAPTPSTSSINVSGLTGPITKVTVTLNQFSHTWTRDVGILLVGPHGQTILTGMVGVDGDGTNGTTANNVTLTFDQTAITSFLAIQTGNIANLLSGIYAPAISPLEYNRFSFLGHGTYSAADANLNAFKGTDANGTWTLYVQDFAEGDVGNIVGGWTLKISTDSTAQPASLEFVTVSKDIDYVQTSADSASVIVDPKPLSPTYGGPYGFSANVQGTNLAGITAPTVTGPFNLNQSNGPSTFSHNGGRLGYDSNDQSWRYGATNFNDWGITSKLANDTSFPNGTYTIQVLGTPVALNLTGDAYPNTPFVTLTGGSWVNGAYEIVVGQTLGISTNTFTAYGTHANDVITLSVGDDTLAELFSSTNSTTKSVSRSYNTSALVGGSSYDLDLGFYAIVDQNPVFPGVFSGAVYGKELRVTIRAATLFTAYLINAGVPVEKRAAADDPDGDGIPNLLEYALGLAPMTPNPTGLPVSQTSGGNLTLTYKRAVATGITYAVQTTTDLTNPASWTSVGVTQGTPDVNGNVTAIIPYSTGTRFLRLQVNVTP